jgi:phosphopantothenoylcysteine decarboxylase/phosphopantothenate--cysteine ligase
MKILVAVTGSIAAYKSYDLVRGFVNAGHEVKVILTKGAEKLIRPELFSYLGALEVLTYNSDFKSIQKPAHILHIELARWCDGLVIAPATANTISNLSMAQAKDLLGNVFLALNNKKTILVPAMNTQMWNHPLFKQRLNVFLSYENNLLVHPAEGSLACGEFGTGKFPNVNDLIEVIPTMFFNDVKKQSILISTGATVAPMDPVRYLTNPSNGITGFEIAKQFLSSGYKVELIIGHNPDPKLQSLVYHPNVRLHFASTTSDMKKLVTEKFKNCDLFISAAAVADIEFVVRDQKIKKSDLKNSLPIVGAVDILAEIIKAKKNQTIISFAAETTNEKKVYLDKIKKKPVDLMVGNIVHSGLIGNKNLKGFQVKTGQYSFFTKKGQIDTKSLTKSELAHYLESWYESRTH